MFIRVTRGLIDREDRDAVLRLVQEQIVPAARQMPGFKSFQLGLERETGRFAAITTFETRQQTEAMNSLRPVAEAAGFEYGPPDVYELVIEA